MTNYEVGMQVKGRKAEVEGKNILLNLPGFDSQHSTPYSIIPSRIVAA
jgi:hypothetical protein